MPAPASVPLAGAPTGLPAASCAFAAVTVMSPPLNISPASQDRR